MHIAVNFTWKGCTRVLICPFLFSFNLENRENIWGNEASVACNQHQFIKSVFWRPSDLCIRCSCKWLPYLWGYIFAITLFPVPHHHYRRTHIFFLSSFKSIFPPIKFPVKLNFKYSNTWSHINILKYFWLKFSQTHYFSNSFINCFNIWEPLYI